jgi:PDZ domain
MRRSQLIAGTVLTILFAFALREISSANTETPPSPAAQQSAPPARFAFGGNAAELPAEFTENLIFLPVDINKSQPSLFELDTTAAASSINRARAAELGITNFQNPVLNFPGLDMPFANLAIVDQGNWSAQIGCPYQGTLGADFLSRVVVEIDYARQTLRLYDPGAYKYSGKGASFPLRFEEGVPIIRAKFTLPGQKTHEGDFVVDTALDASLLISERFAESHRVFSSHIKTIAASDPEIDDGAHIVLGRLAEFQIGHYEVKSPIAAFIRQTSNSASDNNRAGSIGGGMLRRFTIIFDYAHQQIILDPNTHFTDYEQEDKSGIAVVAKGPGLLTFEVASVQPGTPGADAGVKKGDVIAGIDDEAAADLTLAAIRNLFREVGHKYKLLIQRNGESLQLTVQMRRLI